MRIWARKSQLKSSKKITATVRRTPVPWETGEEEECGRWHQTLPPVGHRKRQGSDCESDVKPLRFVGKRGIRTDLPVIVFYFKTFY